MVSGGGGGGGVALGTTSKKGEKNGISRGFWCHFPLEGSFNSLKFAYI